jgi:signal transduction histidine kinase
MGAFLLITGCLLVAAAALLPLRRALFVAAVLLVVIGYIARRTVDGRSSGAVGPLSAACAFLVVLVIRYLAEQRRQGRRLLAAERAATEARARVAAEGERTRIARDLHDGLTHQLSALLLQVQTAQAFLGDGDTAQASTRMAASIGLARQCLTEARDVVDVLRTGHTDLEALRAVADDWADATGRRVQVCLPAAPVDLDGARWGAVMAALRESLTNITRHGISRDVVVEVSVSHAGLRLTVTDTGPDPCVTCAPGQGGGYGLIGLAERAALLHGTLAAGPHHNGWQLQLSLPPPTSEPDRSCNHPAAGPGARR